MLLIIFFSLSKTNNCKNERIPIRKEKWKEPFCNASWREKNKRSTKKHEVLDWLLSTSISGHIESCAEWLQIKAHCKNSKLVHHHHLPGCSLWFPLLHAFSSGSSSRSPWKRSTLAVWVHEGHSCGFITSGNPEYPLKSSSPDQVWPKVPDHHLPPTAPTDSSGAHSLGVRKRTCWTPQEAEAYAVLGLRVPRIMVTVITDTCESNSERQPVASTGKNAVYACLEIWC